MGQKGLFHCLTRLLN